MATKYFINGGVNNNYSADTNWSTTSGGANDTTHATSADDVILDDNSPNCTVDTASAAKSINCAVASHTYANTLTLGANLTVYGSITFVSGMTFTPSTYELYWRATGTFTPAGKSLYDFRVGTQSGAATYTLAGDVTVTNDFIPQDCNGSEYTLVGAYTVYVAGDITVGTDSSGAVLRGAWTININGSSDQTLTWQDDQYWGCDITIASTGGTVYFAGQLTFGNGKTLNIASGTVDATTNTPTLKLTPLGAGANATYTDAVGITWTNVILQGYGANTVTLNNDLKCSGTLSMGGNNGSNYTVNGADIIASGHITMLGLSTDTFTGTSDLIINGGANQTFTGVASKERLALNTTINKSGNTLSLSGTIIYLTGTMTYTAGTVDSGTSTLSIAGSCTLNTNGISWYNITHSATNTTTLSSALTSTGTHTVSAATIFSGAFKVTTGALTLGAGDLTLANDWDVNGTLTAPHQNYCVNGAYNLNCYGNVVYGNYKASTGGVPTLHFVGTNAQSFSTGGHVVLNVNIDKTGDTLTLSGTIIYGYYNTPTFTYTQGTVSGGTSTFGFGGACTLDTNGMEFYTVKPATGLTHTVTLNSDLTISNLMDCTSGHTSFGGTANVLVKGSCTIKNGYIFHHNGDLKFTGTGTLSAQGGLAYIGCDVVIDTTGTLTISDTIYIGNTVDYAGSLTYTTGTVVTTGSTIGCGYNANFDTNGVTWNNVEAKVGTLTLTSDMQVSGTCTTQASQTLALGSNTLTLQGDLVNNGTLDCGEGEVVLDGACSLTGDIDFYDLTVESDATVTLAVGDTFSVSNNFTALSLIGDTTTIQSDTPDTRAIFNVNAGTIDVERVTAIDIDSTGGSLVFDYKGTLDNADNWSTDAIPVTRAYVWAC